MEQKERKIKDCIREGLVLAWQKRTLKKTGNPYATLGNPGPEQETLNADSDVIYKHLETMGMLNAK